MFRFSSLEVEVVGGDRDSIHFTFSPEQIIRMVIIDDNNLCHHIYENDDDDD